jgi:alkylation response protein AidB-like acyl-CoA dehydrogenase
MAILTEEQSMLRDAARGWVQEKAPVSALRKLRDSQSVVSFDPAAFAEVAQMGWAGVVIPEAYGGSEFGYLSLGLVLEEMGKTLAASPLLASALTSASAIVLGGTDTQKEAWLPKIASGALIATLAVDEGPRHDPVVVALKATQSDGGYTLSGSKRSCSKAWRRGSTSSAPGHRAKRVTRRGLPSSSFRRMQKA